MSHPGKAIISEYGLLVVLLCRCSALAKSTLQQHILNEKDDPFCSYKAFLQWLSVKAILKFGDELVRQALLLN